MVPWGGRLPVVWLCQNSDLGIWVKKLHYLRNGDVPGHLVQGMSANMLELGAVSGYFLHSKGPKPAHKIKAHTLKQYAVRQENKKAKSTDGVWLCGYFLGFVKKLGPVFPVFQCLPQVYPFPKQQLYERKCF